MHSGLDSALSLATVFGLALKVLKDFLDVRKVKADLQKVKEDLAYLKGKEDRQ